MSASQGNQRSPHVLIYEPRVEGHHVGNLGFVTDDLLAAGFQITLAIDTRPESFARIREQMSRQMERVRVVPARGEDGRLAKDQAQFLADRLAQTGADFVYLNNFDEIASDLLRRACWGKMPPASLRGRLGGSYSRPRFLAGCGLSPNLWIKSIGFTRLLRQGWFRQLLFPDPYLHAELKAKYPQAPVFFLPDPIPEHFDTDRAEARRSFHVPEGKRVFVFYGGAYKRKGLHLAVKAMRELPETSPAFLLAAGEQPEDPELAGSLADLSDHGRAAVVNRYVSIDEEKRIFAAADFVLLPYIHHFGSSGVLSRAVGAGKPVIASDEQLVGRVVREHGLGLLFPTGNVAALRQAIERMAGATASEVSGWQEAEKVYAAKCTRAAYRAAIVAALTVECAGACG